MISENGQAMRWRKGTPPKSYSHKAEGKGPIADWDVYFIKRVTSKGGHDFLSLKLTHRTGLRGSANYWLTYNMAHGKLAVGRDTARLTYRDWDVEAVVDTLERSSATYLEMVASGELPPLAVAGGRRSPAEELAEAEKRAAKAELRLEKARAAVAAEKTEVDIFT